MQRLNQEKPMVTLSLKVSDDADEISRTVTPLDDSMRKLVQKRRSALKRQTTRLKAKRAAEQNFLRLAERSEGLRKTFLILETPLKSL